MTSLKYQICFVVNWVIGLSDQFCFIKVNSVLGISIQSGSTGFLSR